jgi:hypothetical protein
VQHLDEVGAGLDGVDIQEHPVLAEAPLQMVGEPARVAGCVVPPVADEDPRGHASAR